MKNTQETPDMRAYDILLESSESFEIEDAQGRKVELYIYPFQLGRMLEVSKRLLALDALFEEQMDDVRRLWEVCANHSRQVAEIIAVATLRNREEMEQMLTERTELLLWSPTMTTQAYTNLLYFVISRSYYADFTNAIRLVRTLRAQISPKTGASLMATMEAAASGDK